MLAASGRQPVSGATQASQETGELAARQLTPEEQERLEAAHEALAVVADALEFGDLEPATEYLDEAFEALDGLEGSGAGEVRSVRIALAEGALAVAAAARGGERTAARRYVTGAVVALRGVELDDSDGVVRTLRDLAVARYDVRDYEGARELFEPVLAAQARSLPPEHVDLLRTTLHLGKSCYFLRDYEAAHEQFERLHEVRARTHPPEHLARLEAELHLALTRHELGDFEGALELNEHVHAEYERRLAPDSSSLLTVKSNLARNLVEFGRFQRALELQEQVHEAHERLLTPQSDRLLRTKQFLAQVRMKAGDHAGAAALLEEVLGIQERTLGPEHPALMRTKRGLAWNCFHLGRVRRALALREEVCEVYARRLSPEHPERLSAERGLAVTRAACGDPAGALVLLERQLAIYERLPDRDELDLLATKLNCAAARAALGDTLGAVALFEEVHAAYARLLEPDSVPLLVVKGNLASARQDLGDNEGALELLESVLAAEERRVPREPLAVLIVKHNLALTRKALGDFEGARKLEEEVHDARERLLPPDHPDLLKIKANLAGTRARLGDLEGARELEEHVHAARVRTLAADDRYLLNSKVALALTRHALGDLEGALDLVSSLLDAQLSRAAALHVESPRAARSAALIELGRLPHALSLNEVARAEGLGDFDAEVFSVLESLRLVSTSSPQVASQRARLPELDELCDRLVDVRGELNDLGLAPPGDAAELEGWRRSLADLARQRDALEKSVREELAQHGILGGAITAEDVTAALEAGSAAVSFLRYPRRLGVGWGAPTVDSMLAFVASSGGSVRLVELGASSELEALCARWRALLGKPVERGVPVDAVEEDEERVGRQLRARLLDPCLAALGDEPPDTLHLVLDDYLHLVPVDALPWTDGRRVGEVVSLRFEVSFQRLVAPPPATSDRGTLVAFGGVDFSAEDVAAPSFPVAPTAPPDPERSALPGHFEPLLHSRLEVEALGVLCEEYAGCEPALRLKREATKAELVELAPRARFLHLATHAWFAPETVLSMRDSIEGGEVARLEAADEFLRGFAPETLCGLALAGANQGADAEGRVPGILTAEELGVLDLSECELAILSACETNVGLRRAGQGVQSLQGALHAAGARAAITSLWKVDDAATRRLMELFYTKLWGEKVGKAEALWQAKMGLRAEGFQLRDWAGWVLTGDPK